MTRTDKVIKIAQILEPGLVSSAAKRLLLKAESILEVAYHSDDEDPDIATYHAHEIPNNEQPKEVPLGQVPPVTGPKSPSPHYSPSRSATIKAKKDWGHRRVATKPRQDRIDLVSVLASYQMRRDLSIRELATQARTSGFDVTRDDITKWLKGSNLPGDYKFDQLFAFLAAVDRPAPRTVIMPPAPEIDIS